MKPDTIKIPFAPIIVACSQHFECTVEEFIGSSRMPHIVRAREVCAYLLRQHTLLSWQQIAKVMGRPNHSSVITSANRISKRLGEENELDEQIKNVRAMAHSIVRERRTA